MNGDAQAIRAQDLILPLKAPYNAPIMEVWLASLINRNVVGVDGPWSAPLVYDAFDGVLNPVGGEPTRVMRPNSQDPSQWLSWTAAVEEHFHLSGGEELPPDSLAWAIVEELRGKKSRGRGESARKRNIIAAIPLVAAASALQNQAGIVGSKQYNDYDAVVEQAYAIGRYGDFGALDSAGEHLMNALLQLTGSHVMLARLNSAIAAGVLTQIDPTVKQLSDNVWASGAALTPKPEESPHPLVLRAVGNANPFSWFYQSWNKLMSTEWVGVLPPRRWVDWSVAVIRLGIGMGLLWTNRWYEEIGRMVISDESLPVNDLDLLDRLSSCMTGVDLLRWPESTESPSNRNVKAQFDQSFRRGMNVSLILGDQSLRDSRHKMGIAEFLTSLREDPAQVQQLERALSASYEGNRSVKNLRYTAMDLLSARIESGHEDIEGADHYYLLKHTGRGRGERLQFDPTTETTAVIASLACPSPSASATLGDVSRAMDQLGLHPSIAELRLHLERAGLSRAVADASLQIEVNSAFGGAES